AGTTSELVCRRAAVIGQPSDSPAQRQRGGGEPGGLLAPQRPALAVGLDRRVGDLVHCRGQRVLGGGGDGNERGVAQFTVPGHEFAFALVDVLEFLDGGVVGDLPALVAVDLVRGV